MGELFSEQLRQAIERSGMSRYAIGQAAGIDKATMSRFMAGKVGLSLESIDKIVDVLRLKLVAEPSHKTKKTGTRRPQNDTSP
jgi:transcriptional regulator with XRE-family HTH domain